MQGFLLGFHEAIGFWVEGVYQGAPEAPFRVPSAGEACSADA